MGPCLMPGGYNTLKGDTKKGIPTTSMRCWADRGLRDLLMFRWEKIAGCNFELRAQRWEGKLALRQELKEVSN